MAKLAYVRRTHKGLPETCYGSLHLLKAIDLAECNKPTYQDGVDSFLQHLDEEQSLDSIDHRIEAPTVYAKDRSGQWQRSKRSMQIWYGYEIDTSSTLKRRLIQHKGSERYLDRVLCFWAATTELGWHSTFDRNSGQVKFELDVFDEDSPKDFCVTFKFDDDFYVINKHGKRTSKPRKPKKTGKTQSVSKTETLQQNSTTEMVQTTIDESVSRINEEPSVADQKESRMSREARVALAEQALADSLSYEDQELRSEVEFTI